jgi:hypothetical protein
MLTPSTAVATPSQTSFSNPRQIATSAGTSGVIIYTVPAGKKFQGSIYNNVTAMDITITPAGGSSTTFRNLPTSFPSGSYPLTLVAGTIITSASANNTYLIGVETDA